MTNKKYKNIKEVSNELNLKEHTIRYWDSIDPKTKQLRIPGLSTRSNAGRRYFNKENIKKLNLVKDILFDNGKHNYSLNLVDKMLNPKLNKKINYQNDNLFIKKTNNSINNSTELNSILSNLRNLLKN